MLVRAASGRHGRWDGRGLVSTDWLAAHLDAPELRLFDVTQFLRAASPGPFTVESGKTLYAAGHIPGAAFLDLVEDFSDRSSALNFTWPGLSHVAQALARAGISNDCFAVLYSSDGPMWATRFWWMLRAAGLRNVAVLDGGLTKWRAEGRATETGERHYPSTDFSLHVADMAFVDRDDVLNAISDDRVCTVSALPAAIHQGIDATHWGRAGRISGSRNLPFATLLDGRGCYRTDRALRRLFEGVGAFQAERVICYCGGGISATMIALALVRLGHPSVAVYDGSMAEWARDPALPMESG